MVSLSTVQYYLKKFFIDMRRTVFLALLINVFVVVLLLKVFWPLLSLLVLTGASDAIPRAELVAAPGSLSLDSIPQLIPKIIHQTWKNTTIPQRWREPQKTCLDMHPDYEYKVSRHTGGSVGDWH